MKPTVFFDEFFESGFEESVSPFLRPNSCKWGKNLHLKSALLAALLLCFSYLLPFVNRAPEPISALLLMFAYFFAGVPALIAAIEDLFNLEINIDVLMTLAGFFSILIGNEREGALLLVLFSFSAALENGVRSKAKGAISSLKELCPQMAFVSQEDGSLIERGVKDIAPGTLIHVKAGEIVPLDSCVTEGNSFLNLVHLTGESLPQICQKGDQVPAGARNLEGALTLKVMRHSSDSTLSRLIQLILQAQEAKPKLQKWFDRFSPLYALTILSVAAFLALFLPFFTSMGYLGNGGSIYRSLTFLIAASPCALIIALPIAYLSAVSACARRGILLKGGTVLDQLAKCKTLVLDKTGTITTGQLTCIEMRAFGECDQALALAYSLEKSSTHPIAQALMQYAHAHGARPLPIRDFVQLPGLGVEAEFEGQKVYIGNPEWIFSKLPSNLQDLLQKEVHQQDQLREITTLLFYKEHVTLFRFKDQIRPLIDQTLRELENKLGLHLVMLTGDHLTNARLIAESLAIKEYYAHLKPEDKLNFVSKRPSLIMVGDGINDAPALARATVGISMGKVGSTTAIDASDIVLLQDHIEQLPWLINKSKQVVSIVKQNVLIALAAMVFATLPALLGFIPLWLAVILHEGGTVLVGLNALRLLTSKGRSSCPRKLTPQNSS